MTVRLRSRSANPFPTVPNITWVVVGLLVAWIALAALAGLLAPVFAVAGPSPISPFSGSTWMCRRPGSSRSSALPSSWASGWARSTAMSKKGGSRPRSQAGRTRSTRPACGSCSRARGRGRGAPAPAARQSGSSRGLLACARPGRDVRAPDPPLDGRLPSQDRVGARLVQLADVRRMTVRSTGTDRQAADTTTEDPAVADRHEGQGDRQPSELAQALDIIDHQQQTILEL